MPVVLDFTIYERFLKNCIMIFLINIIVSSTAVLNMDNNEYFLSSESAY